MEAHGQYTNYNMLLGTSICLQYGLGVALRWLWVALGGRKRCVHKVDTLSHTNPAGCVPPAPVCASRGYRSASSPHPRGPAAPAPSGCPCRAPANASQTNGAAHGATPSCSTWPPARPVARNAGTLRPAHGAAGAGPTAGHSSARATARTTATPRPRPPWATCAPILRAARPRAKLARGPAHGAAGAARGAPPTSPATAPAAP